MEDETLTPEKDQQPQPQPMDAETHDTTNSVVDDMNPNSDEPGDSDNSDDSDDEEEAEQKLELQTLESELYSNPSNYDAHLQYIKLLRKMGEIEKLRQARETMSAIFPLPPSMWQEWANDEASLSSGPEAFSAIEKLYERGVSDYLFVPLWCDYLNFIQEHDPSVSNCSPDGIANARNLFERAITAAGLHVADGSKIWEAYREFEQAILLTIDETSVQEKEKQTQRVQNIFQRQLSVPLANLRSTLLAYKAWEVEQGNKLDVESADLDGVFPQVALTYQKALEMYNARVDLEEQISKQDLSESEKIQQFLGYLKFEQSSGDPARVQVLFERAITEFPVSSDLWLDYTRYLDKTFKVGKIVRDAYFRATRNCPWVGELWIRYLLCLERGRAPEKEIAEVFEKSLQCTFSTMEEYLDLFLTRVDGLRRRILLASKSEDLLNYSMIRETFQRASEYLSPHLKNTDKLLRLHVYWARLELKSGKDLVGSREVWESLLKICGSMLEAWQGYIAMEIELGHVFEARSIYKRCYSKRFSGTGSEDICHSWLRFEREFGTLEDFDHAVQKVTPRLAELQLFRLQQESHSLAESTEQRENLPKKNAREKRKSGSTITEEESPSKRQKATSQNSKKVNEKDKAQAQKSVEVNKVEEAQAKEKNAEETIEKQKKDTTSERKKVYTDQCTAFISNIDFKANDDDLRKFFSDVGGVLSIRILHDKFTGKSRGLAYIDFADDAHLDAAVAKNKQKLFGKKLSIAQSDPGYQRRKASTGRGVPMQHDSGARTSTSGESASKDSGEASKDTRAPPFTPRCRVIDNVQLKGKNTFAMPRNVKPLGWMPSKPNNEDAGDEQPKSNDEFRNMFIKK